MNMLEKLEEDSMAAQTVNDKLLLKTINDNKDTVYGKEHGFSNIRSAPEYKDHVPFTTYDDYAELVSRMIKGENDILTVYPIAMYAVTTGSVGVPKMIPVSVDALHKNIGYSFMYEEIGHQKRIPDKKMIVLPMAVETYTESGTPVTNFSGKILLERKEEIVRKLAGPPEIVYGPTSMDYMYLKALYALKEKQVTGIFSSFVSLISDFFCYIERNWKDLCRDIEIGALDPRKNIPDDIRERLNASMLPDQERADELKRIFEEGFVAKDLWPELSMAAGIGTGSFSSYLSSVRKFTQDIPLHMIVYAASEGCFGAAMQFDTSDYVLIPDTAFYEFIPENKMYLPDEELMGQTLGLDQLIPGDQL